MKKIVIGVARFNNTTWLENKRFRENSRHECIYGFDKQIPESIPYGSSVYVIEMNNTKNEIMGIGKIKNILKEENRRRIYNDENYNRYVYPGSFRKDRSQFVNFEIINELEKILFKGTRHFKRGHGLSVVPHERLGCVYKKKPRKPTRCTICDKKGHNKTTCPYKHEKPVKKPSRKYYNKRCAVCGQIEKGHICPGLEINKQKINTILTFFKELNIN